MKQGPAIGNRNQLILSGLGLGIIYLFNAWSLWSGLTTGRVFGRGSYVTYHDKPLSFLITIGMELGGLIFLPGIPLIFWLVFRKYPGPRGLGPKDLDAEARRRFAP